MTQRSGHPKHVDISVRDRLLILAKREDQDYNVVLNLYYRERLLARLADSRYREQFVLKGGALLFAFATQETQELARPTKDLDFRAGGIPNDVAEIASAFAEICTLSSFEDGLVFEVGAIKADRIAEDALYHGVRLSIPVKLASAAGRVQVDIGFGDVITPGPLEMVYPVLLDEMPAPHVLTYSRETVIAEKYEAMLRLSLVNTRMKDFFDVYQLARAHAFEGQGLSEAIRRTCERRGTSFLPDPAVLQPDFGTDAVRQQQWATFLKRGRLTTAPERFADVMDELHAFLEPIHEACRQQRPLAALWSPATSHWILADGTDGEVPDGA